MEYVEMNSMIIEVERTETDELFAWLWEHTQIEHFGAETDQENDFGEVTHHWFEGKLLPTYRFKS